ncbi:hypothetical protein GALMADRAFT_258650 [Galerina marginata CBS 339.88]|uniref:F-box domain-containing protein n=1 Tax=Galerina marginata (strain CBS 339.88) TaxID=685588 RepID=A0A067SJS9_GALM3|nr:hypothetical protein GALMADRAFT_258650 [Galerina marginata CBS 339.88]
MDFDTISDDVWIDIFEWVSSPAQLSVLMQTCRRFRCLAFAPLLRDLHWIKPESTLPHLEAWKGVYRDMTPLPRKLTLEVPFDFKMLRRSSAHVLTPEMKLYDMIHSRIPSFTSLIELVLDGTLILPYTYSVIGAVPTLRSLSIINCTFARVQTPFAQDDTPLFQVTSISQQQPTDPPFPYDTLPITHLSLHNPKLAVNDEYGHSHLHLITAANLSSLSITWTAPLASFYLQRRWRLDALTELDVVMPVLTRDLADSLVEFVLYCSLEPRIQLCIERHTLSDQQIATVNFPLRGVWSYKGPLLLASFSAPRQRRVATNGGNGLNEPQSTVTRVVMTEPLDLGGLLEGLENLPLCLEMLEIQIRKWDIELLFAIRKLFPGIRSLVIRYGKGLFPPNFFITLGANILFDLEHLQTLKLINDPACLTTTRPVQLPNTPFINTLLAAHPPPQTFMLTDHLHADDADEDGLWCDLGPIPILDHDDMKDYLLGWNRYCKRLRHVQLDVLTCWRRQFEGDQWVAVEI